MIRPGRMAPSIFSPQRCVSAWLHCLQASASSLVVWENVRLTLSGREACDRTLAERTGRPFKRAFFHADALHSASRATMAAAAEQSAAEMKRIDGPMCVIEGLVRCPLTLLLPQATRMHLIVSQAQTGWSPALHRPWCNGYSVAIDVSCCCSASCLSLCSSGASTGSTL